MTSTDTTGTHNAAGATDGLLAPIAAAFAVGSRPGVLGLGLAAGAAVGALGGSAASLAYIRSPAAVPYVVVAAGLIVVIWSIAAGAVAVAAGERGASVAAGLRRALRRTGPLVVAAVPAALIVGVLLVAQVGVFALTQMGARGPLGELPARPLALIALVYTLIFVMNVVVIVPAGAALWLVLPHVMRGAGPIEAHARVRDAFWAHPRTVLRMLVGVIIMASAAAAALMGIVTLGLLVVTFAQMLGAGETFLLRFSEPLVSDMFMTVTVDNLAAVVVMATGIGAAVGAATGPSSMFGIAGGTYLAQHFGGAEQEPHSGA